MAIAPTFSGDRYSDGWIRHVLRSGLYGQAKQIELLKNAIAEVETGNVYRGVLEATERMDALQAALDEVQCMPKEAMGELEGTW